MDNPKFGNESVVHAIQDATSAWAKEMALEDLLHETTFQQAFLERAQLALLVAMSFPAHVYCFEGQFFPKAVDVVYYNEALATPAEGQPPILDPDVLLSPYLRFDPGYQIPQRSRRSLALGSGFSRGVTDANAVVALGVALCEIGAWKAVSRNIFKEMTKMAEGSLNEVSQQAGQISCNISRKCLKWAAPSLNINSQTTKELENIVARSIESQRT
ncbi:uncharacterized protein Z518_03153 [Rhinocladiella mackenziei CBS 650.93]|uniref:Uncharacterized protein n=1 Tax=Rhinocladiella mackenziei CBS 650.93 TaxID=1442369 RepID=A0A0D2G201_9EURO|nr:uncharacterized protein Z518_03153 [Rhinocladiella mackenziei CBS 650.93]KIX08497.1 hypothetical protein Z518_03153 [Rhinocladiella mackenziei CBS 650.93]